MMDTAKARELQDDVTSHIRANLRIVDIFVYLMLLFGLAGLGLMNWAELYWDLSRLSEAYFVSLGIQLFSYGAIIISRATHRLDRRKKLDEQLKKFNDYIDKILENYRPEKLDEYIYRFNLNERKETFVEKYQKKLEKLIKKNQKEAIVRSWHEYVRDKEKDPDVQPPNKYCQLKGEYLDKLANWENYYLKESVNYEKISMNDLTVDVGKKKQRKVPRESEGGVMLLGVGRSLGFMGIGAALSNLIMVSLTESGIQALISTFITIFFVFMSALKGDMNGERTFEKTTLSKAKFRKHHLHAYAIEEATKNNFIVIEDE